VILKIHKIISGCLPPWACSCEGESSTGGGGVRPSGEGHGLTVGRPGTSRGAAAGRARWCCPLVARLGRGRRGAPAGGTRAIGRGGGKSLPWWRLGGYWAYWADSGRLRLGFPKFIFFFSISKCK
jgi:hypothetical protein